MNSANIGRLLPDGQPSAQTSGVFMSRLVEDISEWADYSYRMKQELQTAREVQTRFLPHRLPEIADLDFCAECRPAGEVGGDLFDFVTPRGGTLVASIGDVSGKGIPAAILMAGVQSSLRNLSRKQGGPGAIINELNRMVYDVSPDNLFVTLLYLEIDTSRRRLNYVSAGHESALLIRKDTGAVRRLESTGAVLGLSGRSAYRQSSVALQPGDLLVAFTDGVPEAADVWRHEFGVERILRAARKDPDASAREVVASILDAAREFTGDTSAADDRTVMAIRIAEKAAAAAAA